MSQHFSSDPKKLNKRNLSQYTALSKRVASRYKTIGKALGYSAAQLSIIALRGAAYGYLIHYQHKSPAWKRQHKASVYILWWMRRFIHIVLVQAILNMSATNRTKAKRLFLELLED